MSLRTNAILVLCCVIDIFTKSSTHDFNNYTKVIVDTHRHLKTSYVHFLHAPDDDSFLQKIMLYEITRDLLNERIKWISTTYLQLKNLSMVHYDTTKNPLFVIFFTTTNSVQQFNLTSQEIYIFHSKWLIIVHHMPDRPLESFCYEHENSTVPFFSRLIGTVMCYSDANLQTWCLPSNNITSDNYVILTREKDFILNTALAQYKRHKDNWFKVNVAILQSSLSVREDNGTFTGAMGLVFQKLLEITNLEVGHIFKEPFTSLKCENGTCQGIRGKLYSGEADIGVHDFTIRTIDMDKFDFTVTIAECYACIFIKKPDKFRVTWLAYFQGFHYLVWITFIGFIMIISLTITLMQNKTQRNVYSLHGVTESFLTVWGLCCQQGMTDWPRSACLQTTYFFLSVLTVTLYAMYAASVLTYLFSTLPSLPFDDLDGLVRDGSYKLTILNNSGELTNLEISNNTDLRKLRKLLKDKSLLPNTKVEGFQQVCSEKVVFYASLMDLFMIHDSIPCQVLCLIKSDFISFGLMLQKNSPYKELLNTKLVTLFPTGILRHESSKVFRDTSNSTRRFRVTIEDIVPIITFLSGGILLAMIVYLLEKAYFRYKNIRKRAI